MGVVAPLGGVLKVWGEHHEGNRRYSPMRDIFAAFMIGSFLVRPAWAGSEQDTVRLRNGHVLTGVVQIDESNRDGFTVERWDTGGSVFVRWTQITEAEEHRLLHKDPLAKPSGVLVNGVRAMTTGRDVVGVLIKEDAILLQIKTKDSKSPVPVPKSALLRPHESLLIPEAEAFSAEEMVDNRATKADEKDYAAMMALGRFAAGLRLYERAKEFYQKAATADPSKKEETDGVLTANEQLIKEGKATAALAQVKELVDSTDFAKALETAKKLLAEFADTEVARHHKDLASEIQKKAKDYESRKTEYLAENVPQAYKDRRSFLVSQYASAKYKIAEALSLAVKIDEAVVAELARRMKATPEEIQAAWAKRELKARTVSYGDGSWIVKGGQSGGLDTDAKTQPNNKNTGNGGGFGFGGGTGGSRGRSNGGQNPQPQPLGKKLETKDEWWTSASSSERRSFVEAEYAKNSAAVTKEVKTKKCGVCNGEGTRKEVRSGVTVDAKCLRCHGAKEDDIVVYQ
jgi:tetratricopeptide (TPR) repeat protein